jgi:dTMP kinase
MSRGWFITFEGGEGSGKSTQIGRLADALRASGREVIVTREPGGTTIAEAVRAILLDPKFDPDGVTEVFLYEAARRDHVVKVIGPAVERGAVVLSDRFADSSLVYQGLARGVGWDEVTRLNALATGGLDPDLTIVFDMEPQVGLDRARGRNSVSDVSESRLDEEPLEFHEQVRQGFALLAQTYPDRVRVIAATGEPDQVFSRLRSVLPEELL